MTSSVQCPRCGAATPCSSATCPVCVFCLSSIPVPEHVAETIEEDAKLHAEVAQAKQWVDRSTSDATITAITLIAAGVVAAFMYARAVVSLSPTSDLRDPTLGLIVLCMLFVPPVLVGGGWALARRRHAVLAGLPFARMHLDDGVGVHCGSCGAKLEATKGDAVTAPCSFCRVESILPALWVDAARQRKHRQALLARRKQEAIIGGQFDVGAMAWKVITGLYAAFALYVMFTFMLR